MRAAIAPSKGIGDGLIILVAAHALAKKGYEITVFSSHLGELAKWFPEFTFEKECKNWDRFDIIIAQFDYTKERRNLFLRDDASIFYPVYDEKRCPPLKEIDHIFSRAKTMVQNIADIFDGETSCGISPPNSLVPRKEKKRVIIHPTCTDPIRTYSKRRFKKIACKLKEMGYQPVFAVAPNEQNEWGGPHFSDLSELASYIYESGYFIGNESGTSHLASLLGIPTLVVAGDKRRITMWQPGWSRGRVVVPPSFAPNFKGLRLRTNHWQWFISVRTVINSFIQLLD